MSTEQTPPLVESDVIHACPPGDSGLTPCCGRTPFELPRRDRMAVDADLVNCWTGGDPRLVTPPTGGEV